MLFLIDFSILKRANFFLYIVHFINHHFRITGNITIALKFNLLNDGIRTVL